MICWPSSLGRTIGKHAPHGPTDRAVFICQYSTPVMRTRLSPVLLLPGLLIGCAGTPPAEETNVQTAAIDPTTVCEREQITGSKFQKITCRTEADRERDRRNTEAMSEASRRTLSNGPAGR